MKTRNVLRLASVALALFGIILSGCNNSPKEAASTEQETISTPFPERTTFYLPEQLKEAAQILEEAGIHIVYGPNPVPPPKGISPEAQAMWKHLPQLPLQGHDAKKLAALRKFQAIGEQAIYEKMKDQFAMEDREINGVMTLRSTPDATEKALWEKIASIGVGPGKAFNLESLPTDQQAAIAAGVKAASKKIIDSTPQYADAITGQTRENYKHNWIYRSVVTKMGWGANDPNEASYPLIQVDANSKTLDASTNNYTITFEKGEFPPVNAFWSLTMYDGTSQLMIENPINRYLLNSTMLSDMKLNADGSLTLHLQNKAPAKDLENNWLPAPDGTFYMLLRVYWPKEEFLNGTWKVPGVVAASNWQELK